jgi:hypothetical protein
VIYAREHILGRYSARLGRPVGRNGTVIKLVLRLNVMNAQVGSSRNSRFRHFDDSSFVLLYREGRDLRIVKYHLDPTHIAIRKDESIVGLGPTKGGKKHGQK